MNDHPHDRVRGYFTDDRLDLDHDSVMSRAVDVLKTYYRPGLYFTGSAFDRMIAVSPTDRYTADDIVAVSMLSVQVPPTAAVRLLEGAVNDLLQAVPAGASLWTNPGLLDEGGAAWALWDSVRGLEGVGPVTTSKLLAAKRPNLVPVFDRYVSEGLHTGPSFWRFWQDVVRGTVVAGKESLQSLVHTARERAAVPAYVSDLRVVDVVVWMIERHGTPADLVEEAP